MNHLKLSTLFIVFVCFFHQSINYRLPNDSKPLHYKLKFEPHLIEDNFTFDGEAEIFLQIFNTTRILKLHSVNLTILEDKTILTEGDKIIRPNEHIYSEEGDFLILNFPADLEPGNFTLSLKFNGKMNENPRGLFWDTYVNNDNETIFLAATQFEPSFARETFPCWDEPALKATFEISIKHFPNLTALSNMPVESTIFDLEIDEKVLTNFQKTPSMSTYLVCFTVSDFANISNLEGNFSIWSRENIIDWMSFGFEIGLRAFTILEEYTNISYELPKMDVIAIPNYFHGAMENWGLIVFREEDLLKNINSSESDILKTYKFMVHEVSHQWFGNLVSPDWWSDLWITEGLASYFHYFLTAKVINFARMMDLFVVMNTFRVYEKEEEKLFLPLLRNVTSSNESHDLLLGIHEKSATMMHMLSGLMSREIFQTGIRKLLQKYRFGTVTTDNFWETMQSSLNESKIVNSFEIKKVMESYLSQVGYPVINMTRNYTTGTIVLTQECPICLQINKNKTESKFWIPINFVKSSSLNFSSTLATHYFSPEAENLTIEGIDPDDWVIFNIQSSAFYRVNYDEKNWEKISNFLNSANYSKIHVLNRAQLLNDALWLVKRNKLDLHFFINLTSFLAREVDYIPWASGDDIILYLDTHGGVPNLKEFVLKLVEAVVEDSEIEQKQEQNFFTTYKRFIGTYWSCYFGKRHCDKVDW